MSNTPRKPGKAVSPKEEPLPPIYESKEAADEAIKKDRAAGNPRTIWKSEYGETFGEYRDRGAKKRGPAKKI